MLIVAGGMKIHMQILFRQMKLLRDAEKVMLKPYSPRMLFFTVQKPYPYLREFLTLIKLFCNVEKTRRWRLSLHQNLSGRSSFAAKNHTDSPPPDLIQKVIMVIIIGYYQENKHLCRKINRPQEHLIEEENQKILIHHKVL